MSDMVKYRAVSFKKDQIAALYFTMSEIVHFGQLCLIILLQDFERKAKKTKYVRLFL